MANRTWTLEECKEHFEEQKPRIEEQLEFDEWYKPLLDYDNFDGSCYDPIKVITSHGRVWSLRENHSMGDFLDLNNSINEHGYMRTTPSGTAREINPRTGVPFNRADTMPIHKLVANYFCNKSIFDVMRTVNEREDDSIFDLSTDIYGNYNDVNIHHMDHNKLNNRADNLQYIYDKLHDVITALHNRENNNLPPRLVAKYQNVLHTFGLDTTDPEFEIKDRTILDIINNADQPGIKIYGYVNPGNEKGYKIEIGVKGTIQGNMTEDEKLDFLDRYFTEAPAIRKLIGKEKK